MPQPSWVPKKSQRDKGGGSKKYGRNRIKCARYRAMGRREANKRRRAAKRARKSPLACGDKMC